MVALHFDWKEFIKTPNLLSIVIKLALIVFFLVVVYFQDFGQVISLALGNTEVQYIVIVPLVAAFFFYMRRKAFLFSRENSTIQNVIGALTCLLALVIYIYGSYSLYPVELHLFTLPIFTAGLILLFFGADTLRSLAFPTALLIFVSPFPLIFSDQYGGYLIESTTTLAASFLKLFLPLTYSVTPTALINTVTRTGQEITFEVAPACSGIYSLIAMTFFAVIFLYVVSGSWMKKILFASLSIIMAFLLNILRIVLTVTIGYSIGYGAALEFFHDFAGSVLLFLGVLLLLVFGDKLLKLSFLKEKTPDCLHSKRVSALCCTCGKVFNFPKIPLNWKRLAIICLFLLIVMALFMQASAATYNKASNDKNNNIQLDLITGNTTAFAGLNGWTPQFTGRETSAENVLGLKYVGDYVLANVNGSQVNAILEVSDAQSKFHTWEGCLYYQSTPMNIEKTTVLTLYDQQNMVVTAESMVADIPAYQEKLLLLYWFDSANLNINGTSTSWALKVTLYQTIGNNTATTDGTNNLIALGTQIEDSWSQYKNPTSGFSVDIYRNITPAFIVTATVLGGSITILEMQSLQEKRKLKTKATTLPPEAIKQLNALTNKTTPTLETEQVSSDQIDQLKHEGFIKEHYVLINGQPYLQWKNQIRLTKK